MTRNTALAAPDPKRKQTGVASWRAKALSSITESTITNHLLRNKTLQEFRRQYPQTTLYHFAATTGDTALLKQLLDWSKDAINQPCQRGLMPLDYAALHGHVEIAKQLIIGGADLTQVCLIRIADALVPTHFKAEYLRDKGALLNKDDLVQAVTKCVAKPAATPKIQRLRLESLLMHILTDWRSGTCEILETSEALSQEAHQYLNWAWRQKQLPESLEQYLNKARQKFLDSMPGQWSNQYLRRSLQSAVQAALEENLLKKWVNSDSSLPESLIKQLQTLFNQEAISRWWSERFEQETFTQLDSKLGDLVTKIWEAADNSELPKEISGTLNERKISLTETLGNLRKSTIDVKTLTTMMVNQYLAGIKTAYLEKKLSPKLKAFLDEKNQIVVKGFSFSSSERQTLQKTACNQLIEQILATVVSPHREQTIRELTLLLADMEKRHCLPSDIEMELRREAIDQLLTDWRARKLTAAEDMYLMKEATPEFSKNWLLPLRMSNVSSLTEMALTCIAQSHTYPEVRRHLIAGVTKVNTLKLTSIIDETPYYGTLFHPAVRAAIERTADEASMVNQHLIHSPQFTLLTETSQAFEKEKAKLKEEKAELTRRVDTLTSQVASQEKQIQFLTRALQEILARQTASASLPAPEAAAAADSTPTLRSYRGV